MGPYILSITAVFQIGVFLLTLYTLIIALFGLIKKKEKKHYDPRYRFALIIAAHNEEMVIANLIESMKKLKYPKSMYDIFVIADNCTDNTAKIAREHGALVYERENKEERGKGYALEWMFDKIFQMDGKYDAVGIFDADNLVSPNFLTEINAKMCEGFKVVQGYIDSKNPNDSWVTASYAISYWTQNRMYQLSRENLGLSNQIGGTGFTVDIEVLEEIGWGATCLTEDLEFTSKLVLNGKKVGWAHDAIVYDEKPLTLKQSWRQRKRWMQGFADVASRFFFKLLKKGIKERDFVAIDCALYTIQPFTMILLGVSLVLSTLQASSANGLNIFLVSYLFNENLWKAFLVFQFIITPLYMLLDKRITKQLFIILILCSVNMVLPQIVLDGEKNLFIIYGFTGALYLFDLAVAYVAFGKKTAIMFFRYLMFFFIYTITWIPIAIQGIIHKNDKEWSHTEHVRQIGIYDI